MWEEWKVKVKSLSLIWLFATPWTVAHQAPPSMGFSRQEYWGGLPFPPPRDLPNPGMEPRSPALQADTLTSEPPGKPKSHYYIEENNWMFKPARDFGAPLTESLWMSHTFFRTCQCGDLKWSLGSLISFVTTWIWLRETTSPLFLEGLPVVQNLPANAGGWKRRGFNSWVGKILWTRKWKPIPVFLPRKFRGQRNLAGYSPRGCTTEWLTLHT